MTQNTPLSEPAVTSADRPTEVIHNTSIFAPGQREASEPPEVAICFHCWATDDRPTPPGWVMPKLVPDRRPMYRFGVCPACLTSVYQLPAKG